MQNLPGDSEGKGLRGQLAKAEYIEQMLRELSRLSSDLDSQTLSYLLEMATIEATDIVKLKRHSAEKAGRHE